MKILLKCSSHLLAFFFWLPATDVTSIKFHWTNFIMQLYFSIISFFDNKFFFDNSDIYLQLKYIIYFFYVLQNVGHIFLERNKIWMMFNICLHCFLNLNYTEDSYMAVYSLFFFNLNFFTRGILSVFCFRYDPSLSICYQILVLK